MPQEIGGITESIIAEVIKPPWWEMILLGRASLLDYLIILFGATLLSYLTYRQVKKWRTKQKSTLPPLPSP